MEICSCRGAVGSLGRLTYGELQRRAWGLAGALDAMGVGLGERVAIVSPNAAKFLASFFGVSAYGRILVPVNFRLNAEEITYIIEHSGASVMLVDPELDSVTAGTPVKHRILLDGMQDAELFEHAHGFGSGRLRRLKELDDRGDGDHRVAG